MKPDIEIIQKTISLVRTKGRFNVSRSDITRYVASEIPALVRLMMLGEAVNRYDYAYLLFIHKPIWVYGALEQCYKPDLSAAQFKQTWSYMRNQNWIVGVQGLTVEPKPNWCPLYKFNEPAFLAGRHSYMSELRHDPDILEKYQLDEVIRRVQLEGLSE